MSMVVNMKADNSMGMPVANAGMVNSLGGQMAQGMGLANGIGQISGLTNGVGPPGRFLSFSPICCSCWWWWELERKKE